MTDTMEWEITYAGRRRARLAGTAAANGSFDADDVGWSR